jgi:hypothetical protein
LFFVHIEEKTLCLTQFLFSRFAVKADTLAEQARQEMIAADSAAAPATEGACKTNRRSSLAMNTGLFADVSIGNTQIICYVIPRATASTFSVL